MGRGFDLYHPTPPEGRLADGTTRTVLEWIDLNRDGPFLMFAHYFDPHEPYAPPPPYDTLFGTGYDGHIGNAFRLRDYFPNVIGINFEDLRSLTGADWDHIRALYDGEIAFTDMAVDDLLQGISAMGIRDNTLIVFLSDHGEEFFEHEGFGHGHTLFGEVIRVPLIFSCPSRFPRDTIVDRQVRLVDVMPTILDIMDIEIDSHCEGASLLPLITGTGEVKPPDVALFPPRAAYSEGLLQGPEKKAVTAYPWKLIYNLRTRHEMLFNLEQDSSEKGNLLDTSPEALPLLEGMVFATMLEMSRTWHIEMAGAADGSAFDVSIRIGDGTFIGRIPVFTLLDSSGRIATMDPPPTIDPTGSSLAVNGLRIKDRVELAFTVQGPPHVPVILDIRIDGDNASDKTFIGETLRNPRQMPFKAGRRRGTVDSRAGPPTRPQPPYCVVWHSEPQYTGDTAMKLNDQTRRELKALGYIQ
jgi:hypothetical protein